MQRLAGGDSQALSRRDILGATALLLAGCGGGGGGGDSPAPAPEPGPPAASLTLETSATMLTAGGGAQRLRAVLSGASDTILWSLSGPGSLSETRGPETLYLPPRADEQRVAVEVRITASAADLVREVGLEISAAPSAPVAVPGTEWATVSYPKYGVTDVQWLGGHFYAVTSLGGVMVSVDGIGWVARRTQPAGLTAITLGDRGYVAVGRDAILHSPDGIAWTRVTWSGFRELHDVVAGNGVYVAIGPAELVTSRDGLVWEAIALPTGTGFGAALAFGGGQFLVVRVDGVAFTSPDGTAWTRQSLPASSSSAVAVGYGNGRFVVVSDAAHLSSVDGRTWTRLPGLGIKGDRIRFSGSRFYLRGISPGPAATPTLYSSRDGEEWLAAFFSPPGVQLAGMAENGGRQVAAHEGGPIQMRSEGGAFRSVMKGPSEKIGALIGESGGLLALPEQGSDYRSDRGRTWVPLATVNGSWTKAIAYGRGLYVRFMDVGANALLTSTNARDWTPRSLPSTFRPSQSAVVFADGRFVSVGMLGEAFYSLDGLTWLAARSPIRAEMTAVTHGAGRFVAVGFQSEALISADGSDWTIVQRLSARLSGVCHGPAGFVAVGGREGPVGSIWFSPDGVLWTQQDVGPLNGLWAVTYGHGLYVAVGNLSEVWVSSDAVHWSRRDTDVHSGLQCVLAFPGGFVAGGAGGTILLSNQ